MCCFSSEIIKQLDAPAKKDNFIGGVVNPCYIYATDLNDFYNLMDKINENGKVDAVVSCVAIPKFFVNFHSLGNSGGTGGGNVDPPPIGVTNNYLGSPLTQVLQSHKFTTHLTIMVLTCTAM